jgi:hypothetical protein
MTEDTTKLYGGKLYPDPAPDYPVPISKVKIKPYGDETNVGFMETPKFWMDMVLIGEQLAKYPS